MVSSEDIAKAEALENEGHRRQLPIWVDRAVYVFAIVYSLFHFAVLNFMSIDEWVYRVVHINMGAVIAIVTLRGFWFEKDRVPIWDWALCLASIGCTFYIIQEYESLVMRTGVITTFGDLLTGAVGTFVVLEFARRTSGLILPVIALIFMGYVFVGPYLPGILHHNGFQAGNFFSFIYSQEGIFGITAAASSRYIILFISFAVFLQVCGAGDYFMRLALCLFGWMRGGPGKVSVVSGMLFGSVSGSAVANVVATGTFTIPMMRKAGYPRATAGAIEAASSTGGQLAPPIMGAGAFIMAEATGIPYSQIVVAAILPCLLFYAAIFANVDMQAVRHNIRGIPRAELPSVGELAKDVFLLLPLVVLLYILLSGYSIIAAGTWGVASTLLVLAVTRMKMASYILAVPMVLYVLLPLSGIPINMAGATATLLGAAFLLVAGFLWKGPAAMASSFKEMFQVLGFGLSEAAHRSLQLIAVLAAAGIVVGVLGLTGLGGRFSSILLTVAGDNVLIAFIIAMGISILLGMGMPTTAAYAIAAAVVAPALQRLGVPMLAAHMFVFYCAVLSAITPPVAIAGFAAAAIAGAKPFETTLRAMRFAIGAFAVPFLFYSSPAILLDGTPTEIVSVFVTGLAGVILLAVAGEGRLYGELNPVLRILLGIGALLLFVGGGVTDLIGAVIAATIIIWRFTAQRRDAAT